MMRRQLRAAVAADAAVFVVVERGGDQDGSGFGVFGQRNKPDRLIRGKTIDLSNPTGSEEDRRVMVRAQEDRTEIGTSIDGDPSVDGATLSVIANGTTNSDQTYILDPSGCRSLGTRGFKYRVP